MNLSAITRERVRRTRCFYARSLLLNAAKRTQMKQHELNESGEHKKPGAGKAKSLSFK